MDSLRDEISPYRHFERNAWAKLRADTPMTLDQADIDELRGLNDRIDLAEVVAIYLPLSRLLNLYVAATQELFRATDRFLHGVIGKDHAARRADCGYIATAGVRSHPAVSRLLFWPIAQMEGLGIAPRKGLDFGCARLPNRLVALQCILDTEVRNTAETGCQHSAIFNRLGGALCHVREHWMAGIAKQRHAAQRPRWKRISIKQGPLVDIVDGTQDCVKLRMPARVVL